VTASVRANGPRTKRWTWVLITAAVVVAAGSCLWVTEFRPWLYGMEAYIYGFPLIMMDLTKDVSTAVPAAEEFTAPVNQFSIMTHYPDASFRAVARTGLDTSTRCLWCPGQTSTRSRLCSRYLTPVGAITSSLFDMWSNVFASIGKRNTGTGAANFLIADLTGRATHPRDKTDIPLANTLCLGERPDADRRAE